ncbi:MULTISPECIES: RDD family protein [unclassified Paenibacillus]|uniref:RDD family protein n=1 Tax=unclassified Paenibacillus TaxID=185978 RepID=UPI002789C83C|nr:MULTISPECIES: RDD family protein [unclassified Paenibacillus]MDQ0896370.1 putative RDD family membrane protein YckC [Paenibacillus sp. V4I7]MDQ0914086.1 putative RDD family membrane protein YckC [Paenibacillus sp. V4I5]
MNNNKEVYAGFWLRTGAYVIDAVLVFVVTVIIGFAASLIGAWSDYAAYIPIIVNLVMLVASMVYLIGMETKYGATLGKLAVGIQVVKLDGTPVPMGKVVGRYFSKIISSILCIGYIMVAFTERKQGLHDIMSGCLVVKKNMKHQIGLPQ